MLREVPHTYNFDFVGGIDNRYNFLTVNSISYTIRFKPSVDYIPFGETWRDEFFELLIEVAFAPNPDHIPNDPVIAATVFQIVSHFFEGHERVILYICDDSDSRQVARKRKFDNWFNRFDNHPFEKYDLPKVVQRAEHYFASIFFHRDNPNRFSIINAFEKLADGQK